MGNENKVAIIGMAGRFPGAKTLKEFWSNLENGVESLSDFTDEDLLASGIPESRINDENLVKKGFVLDDIDKFDAKFFNCSPSEARMMDPQIRFFLECAWEVLENSGYDLGSAINNDGTMKMSYTAPSIQGQSEVIAEALAIADVPADSITYVEAHGTGTPIGDPAEVAALSEAFGAFTDKKRFCGIGSVKTNIGHLDTAAGIAGLIKTVLAMKNKKIPASLHFKKPNPEIDFENSPFYVNAELKDWNQHGPLRAGVSSFGIGGTNAHLILESYPETFSSEESDSWKVMTLSAKTESALNKIAINLADYLESSPSVNLTDVVHTLQIGRKEFEHRRVVVCQKREQAIDMLRAKAERVLTDNHDRSERRLVFMFPGQGSQYPQMAKDLYQQESVFKKELDFRSPILKMRQR